MYTLLASLTWLLVEFTKYRTPLGVTTPWRRVGLSALLAWGALSTATLVSYLNLPVISATSDTLQIALLPSAVVFPIWAAAAFRNRKIGTSHPAD